MNRGPFGFPRVTGVGPFVDKKAEQRFIVEQTDTNFISHTGIEIDLGTQMDKDPVRGDFKRVVMRLEVLEEPEKSDKGGILGDIEETIREATRETRVAVATYNYDPESNIAVTGKISVDEDFRRMGIGSTIARKRDEDMIDRGVEEVWALAATDGGRKLLSDLGYTENDPLYPDDEDIMYKRFTR